MLSPEIAALAMSGGSALVAANALMLKRTRLEGIRGGGAPEAEVVTSGDGKKSANGVNP